MNSPLESKRGHSLYSGTLAEVELALATAPGREQFVEQLKAAYQARHDGELPEPQEISSWEGTLPRLVDALRDLPAAAKAMSVLLEFALPDDELGRRVDVLLVGRDAGGQERVLVIELKGWAAVLPPLTPEQQRLRTVFIHGQERKHPVPQVLEYQYDLQYHNSAVLERRAAVSCAAYLPNLPGSLLDVGGRSLESVFYSGQKQAQAFARFVQEQVGHGAATQLTGQLDHSAVVWQAGSAQAVSDAVTLALRGDRPYELTPQQREVARRIWQSVTDHSRGRQLILVPGDPGTGKTAVALQLLLSASDNFTQRSKMGEPDQGQYVKLVIPGAFLSATIRAAVPFEHGPHTALLNRLLGYPGGMREGTIPLVLCDEAHRIANGKLRQVVNSGRTVVLFYDEYQVIDPNEGQDLLNLLEQVRQGASNYEGIPVTVIDGLPQQMRCRSPSYVAWARALIRNEPVSTAVKDYELNFFDDPADLEQHVQQRGGRLLAGFCWPWSRVPEVREVVIGSWQRPWNPAPRPVGQPQDHAQVRWMKGEDFREHIGCIYTAQGVEFEHAGVIWGNDVVWRTDHWEVRVAENRFGAFQRVAGRLKDPRTSPQQRQQLEQSALRCLLNIYYVLLTRGKQSTSLHFTDQETARHVRACWEAAQF